MLYGHEVVKIDLEQVRGMELPSDHDGVAPPYFSKEQGNLVGGITTPRAVHCPHVQCLAIAIRSLGHHHPMFGARTLLSGDRT